MVYPFYDEQGHSHDIIPLRPKAEAGHCVHVCILPVLRLSRLWMVRTRHAKSEDVVFLKNWHRSENEKLGVSSLGFFSGHIVSYL